VCEPDSPAAGRGLALERRRSGSDNGLGRRRRGRVEVGVGREGCVEKAPVKKGVEATHCLWDESALMA